MADSQKRSAEFVRGFFSFLESRQLRSAVLHGGADGFEHDLSDVDFVVERRTFPQLAGLIDGYCEQTGWRLCQILRHETTAAYFVCSAADDPACAVALDACSDYQRNGTVFLMAETLLENPQALPWGGFEPAPATRLRYRFAKAAAKNKQPKDTAEEFSRYSEEARRECGSWLSQCRGITLGGWDADNLEPALKRLRQQSNDHPPLFQASSLARVARRIFRPTGMVVVTGSNPSEEITRGLCRCFGRLYFRRTKTIPSWRYESFRDVIQSTLVLVPELGATAKAFIPRDCVIVLKPEWNLNSAVNRLAAALQLRCAARTSRSTRFR